MTATTAGRSQIVLQAQNAADLMTENPVSISETATVEEAITLLVEKGFSAAPVIDQAGRAVGVLSQRDILIHDRERENYLEPIPRKFEDASLAEHLGEPPGAGFQVLRGDRTVVRDIMTPMVFSVSPEAPAAKVVEQMLAMKFHRLFVVDDDGILVGVISALDILQRLHA
jgi:CBS domain-containing protein